MRTDNVTYVPLASTQTRHVVTTHPRTDAALHFVTITNGQTPRPTNERRTSRSAQPDDTPRISIIATALRSIRKLTPRQIALFALGATTLVTILTLRGWMTHTREADTTPATALRPDPKAAKNWTRLGKAWG